MRHRSVPAQKHPGASEYRPVFFLLLLSLGCQDPTQVRLHVRTDVPYEPGRMLSFVATTPERFATSPAEVVVDKPWGARGDVGTLVVVPEGEKNGRVAIRVVMGVAKDPTECTAEQPDGCIVTRRLLRFVENRSVELPIGLHARCEGVSCDESSTCNALGECVSAEIDPNRCEDPSDPGCLPSGDLVPIGVPEPQPEAGPEPQPEAGPEPQPEAGPEPQPEAGPEPQPEAGPDAEAEGGLDCTGYQPAMVEMPEGFCIDVTEVTRTQYDQWLSSTPTTSDQASECSWNDSYEPSCEWPPDAKGDYPVVCVDWCDAYAYCGGVGKRLCGKIGGGANGYGDWANAGLSQWYAACSAGGQDVYPYGDTYQEQTCNGSDNAVTGCGIGSCTTAAAGSLGGCQSSVSGYVGVYDLSGNAWEWEDSCDGNAGPIDRCRLRGGSFDYHANSLRCDVDFDLGRDYNSDGIGFRCCSSP